MELTALQARVIASLMEKAATTPDNYPLTTNSLVAACNQSTNRDPVVAYGAGEVDTAMIELRQLGLARSVSGAGHRSAKHRHVVGDAFELDGSEVAVLAVLTLRGPQTLNEISTRTERYLDGPGGDVDAVDAAIDRLAGRAEPLVRRIERRPGEREPRVEPLWQPAQDQAAQDQAAQDQAARDQAVGTPGDTAPADTADSTTAPQRIPTRLPTDGTDGERNDRADDLADRVATLEAALARQTARLDALLAELGVDDPDGGPDGNPDDGPSAES